MYKKRAFTLMELMIVVAIIGVLSTISVVTYNNAKARSLVSKAKTDVSSIASGVKMLFQDTKEYSFHFQANCRPPVIDPKYTIDHEIPIVASDDLAQVGSYCSVIRPTPHTPETDAAWYAACAKDNNAARKMPGLAGAMGLLKNDNGLGGTPYKNWAGPYIEQIPESDPWGMPYYWEGDYGCFQGELGEDDTACQGIFLQSGEKSYNVTAISSQGPITNIKPEWMSEEEWANETRKGYGGDNISVMACKRNPK